jgi:anti-sigma B factor antagonist
VENIVAKRDYFLMQITLLTNGMFFLPNKIRPDLDFLMDIFIHNIDKVAVVEASGHLDSNTASEFEAKVLPLAHDGQRILLDMSGVDYMSSAGLRVLLLIYRQITDSAGHIVLTGLQDEIKDTMAITGFLDFFTTIEDRTAALQLLKGT